MHRIKLLLLIIVNISLIVSQLVSQDQKTFYNKYLVGLWNFNNPVNLLQAAVGEDLLLHGTHTAINGMKNSDKAVTIGTGSYYICTHSMIPLSDEKHINRYTIIMDIRAPIPYLWYTLYQTNQQNSNDGDAFIKDTTASLGVGATGYASQSVIFNVWFRVAIVVDNHRGIFNYYINGKKILEGKPQEKDNRFSVDPTLLFLRTTMEKIIQSM